ncbi:hypothetical protein BFW01_g5655 [Lasiodiplodia theobromae]|nr:hypothetical protein BFW01_g5655 [Lasiodiplodia theobromae]
MLASQTSAFHSRCLRNKGGEFFVLISSRLWLLIAYVKIKSLLRISPQPSDYSSISSLWQQPSDAVPLIEFFSDRNRNSEVKPLPCHSHNDYWRKVPLFDALAYGCASVEADIWLPLPPAEDRVEFGEKIVNIELQVGHVRDELTVDRTLDSLYLAPLFRMFYERTSPDDGSTSGIFESSPSTTLVLLLDFKSSTDPSAVWRALQIHLVTFREFGWLTHWDREQNRRITRPLTIVVTGDARFEDVIASPYRDVFYDAPLEKLATDSRYNASNSYYTSASLGALVGKVGLGRSLNGAQMNKLEDATGLAKEKGLVSRIWGTPSWPIGTRNRVWEQMLEVGVDVLNVDEFETATKKDWRLCKVAGVDLCT